MQPKAGELHIRQEVKHQRAHKAAVQRSLLESSSLQPILVQVTSGEP